HIEIELAEDQKFSLIDRKNPPVVRHLNSGTRGQVKTKNGSVASDFGRCSPVRHGKEIFPAIYGKPTARNRRDRADKAVRIDLPDRLISAIRHKKIAIRIARQAEKTAEAGTA